MIARVAPPGMGFLYRPDGQSQGEGKIPEGKAITCHTITLAHKQAQRKHIHCIWAIVNFLTQI